MDILIFHPGIDKHPTDNEQTLKQNEFFTKVYEVKSLEWFVKNLHNPKVKVIYFNWFENPVKNNNPIAQWPLYRIKLWLLRHCKRKGIKIVYAFHNQVPHGVNRETFLYRGVAKPFEKKALSLADSIVIHSRYTKEYLKEEFGFNEDVLGKAVYIPIGKEQKYITEPRKYHLRERLSISEQELVFGYIGRLNEYKQIDKAIIAFQEANVNAKLVIIGSADSKYQEKLNALIESENIIIEYRYIDDDEMNNSIADLDVMILPYDRTCLNSGPMLQAFLNGTTVIGTAIGTARDYPSDLMYTYDYDSDEDHINKIIDGIKKASADFELGSIHTKGKSLQKLIIENNDWQEVEKLTMNVVKQ